ncbi:MAG: hypothetical protein H6742_07370 [Alphaproteobacteria bacterium]|nr:hypothetical protein [Alphaproteobacteria bacterium]
MSAVETRTLIVRRHRRGEGAVNGVLVAMVLVVAVCCYLGAAFVPAWMDRLAYRECATIALLDYIETSSTDSAYETMDRELTERGVQEWVSSAECSFEDPPMISCSTVFYAYYPGTQAYKTFPYDLTVTMQNGKPVAK